jgi:hypothetical protein
MRQSPCVRKRLVDDGAVVTVFYERFLVEIEAVLAEPFTHG